MVDNQFDNKGPVWVKSIQPQDETVGSGEAVKDKRDKSAEEERQLLFG